MTTVTVSANNEGYWTTFPATYRMEQIDPIARWIALGESGVIVGGSGAGKSNLLNFMLSRPEAVCHHLPGNASDYCFLHLDSNGLPALTTSFFYRGLLHALEQAASQIDANLEQQMNRLVGRIVNWEDTLSIYFALQQAHELLVTRGKKIVWLLDRFDVACQTLEAGALNSLRNLRDQNRLRGRLSYLVFTRHPLARLRNPAEFDEFHEIMAGNTCWVRAMVERDARWIAQQMAERHQAEFTEEAVTQLIAVTGGLPAFLKAACTALASGVITPGESAQQWCQMLLGQVIFQRNCEEIWHDCSEDEKSLLTALANGRDPAKLDGAIVEYLRKNGLLVGNLSQGLTIFSPLLASFIRERNRSAQGVLSIDAQNNVVLCDGQITTWQTTQLEQRLLSFLLQHPNQVCEKDRLIAYIWPDEKVLQGIRDDSLAQLVKRLRDKLKACNGQHEYIQVVHGRGYRFVQP